MTIKNIKIGFLSIPLIKPFKTALRTVYSLEAITLKIVTDMGIEGYGETAPTKAITGETKESIQKAVEIIGKKIIGKNLEDFNHILDTLHKSVEGNFSAKSAIEIALYDIVSQNAKMPLFRYLGGNKKDFKTNSTISLNPIDMMIQDSLEALNDGFASLKIKLGDNYKEDIQRVIEISRALGDDISLKLDANQGWSPKESVSFLNAIENHNIAVDLIEQPVGRYDIEGLKYIKERTSIPVMADESVFSPMDAIKVLEAEAVDIVNIKLDKCGGISKALQIADICKLYDTKCMIGCMLEGAISVGAAAHVASAKSDIIMMHDLDSPMLCKTTPVVGGAVFSIPNVTLSESYGLGVQGIEELTWA